MMKTILYVIIFFAELLVNPQLIFRKFCNHYFLLSQTTPFTVADPGSEKSGGAPRPPRFFCEF